ncbi:MAG: HslU--HslV peptidase proteolytic subunit [Planctomycetota bacterium]|nr:MAG: HslU--HslV peptidase proteolytic subunit [Planctomycetota bacterium]
MRGTTIVVVRKDGVTAMASDGQVTIGDVSVKQKANKVRRLSKGEVLAGFSGAVADSLALLERFEGKLEEFGGDLRRAAVEMAKLWRTDRVLRRLEAFLLVADAETILLISGGGDVLEPEEPVMGIGSGGAFAHAAALALLRHSDLNAEQIAEEAIRIAARLCIYTNENINIEVIKR